VSRKPVNSGPVTIVVVERDATCAGPRRNNEVVLRQWRHESGREFAQRVATRLGTLTGAGISIGGASLELADSPTPGALQSRLALSRVLLSQLPNFEGASLELGGPLAESTGGQLDLRALADTLSPLVWGSTIRVRPARAPRSAPRWEIPTAA